MFKQTLYFLVSVLLVFIVCELFIRTTHLAPTSPNKFYDDIGRGRRSNVNFVYFNEGFGIGRFNEQRFIGEDISLSKSNNTIRIVLLGDSYVESFQIVDRNHFRHVLADELSRKFNQFSFEILNLGRSGFDLADMYAYQLNLADKFDPDLILYFLSPSDLESKITDELVPSAILLNSKLEVKNEFSQSRINKSKIIEPFIQNSSILNMVSNGYKKSKKVSMGQLLFGKLYKGSEFKKNEISKNDSIFFPFDSISVKIIQNVNPNKVIFINRDIHEMPRDIIGLMAENELKFIDLKSFFIIAKEKGLNINQWSLTQKGHWNHVGHQVLGEELSKKLIPVVDSYIENNTLN